MWLTPTAGGTYCCQVTVGPLPLCSQVLLFFCGGGGGGADITTKGAHGTTDGGFGVPACACLCDQHTPRIRTGRLKRTMMFCPCAACESDQGGSFRS